MYCKKIKEGIDPIQERRQVRSTLKQKQDNTFEKVALEWLEKWSHGREGREASIRLSRLKRHIFSYLGNIPIQDITTEDLISVIKRIEDKGTLAEAEKTRGIVNLIFKYAVATSRIKHNIMADTVEAYKVATVKHFPRFNEKEFGEFLKKDVIEWMQKKAATDQMFIFRLNSDFVEDYMQLHSTKTSENEKVSKEDFFKLLAKEIQEDIASINLEEMLNMPFIIRGCLSFCGFELNKNNTYDKNGRLIPGLSRDTLRGYLKDLNIPGVKQGNLSQTYKMNL